MTSRRNERQLTVALTQQDRGFKAGLEAGRKQARKFGREVDQVSQGGIKRMNSGLDVAKEKAAGFRKELKVLATALALREVAQFVAGLKDSAVDLNESINAINVAAGAGADQILAFGENAATAVGLAQSEFNQAVTPIVAQLNNFGFSAEEAGDAAIVLTERAADLASVFNTDVDTALTAIQAALRGESDPIEKFGASISAARVEAFLLSEGLVESKGAITDADKVMGRYKLLLEDTASVQGDFANTSDELANKTRIFEARLEDWRASVGQSVIPLFEQLLGVGEDLLPVLETLGEDVVPVIVGAFMNFAAGVQALVEGFSDLPGPVKTATGVVAGLSAAIALLVSHPYVAGLALVAAGIGAIGAKAGEEKARVDDLRDALIELREEGNKAPLDLAVGEQIAEAVGDADKLLGVLDLIGVSYSQFKGFAIGDPDDVRIVTAAFKAYEDAQNAAFERGDIGADALTGLIGLPSDFAFVEEKLGDVQKRVSEVAEEYDSAAEEQAKLQNRQDIEDYNRLMSRQHAIISDTVAVRRRAAEEEAAAAALITEHYDELEKQLLDIADTYAGRLSSAALNYLDIFTEAPDIEVTSAEQLLTNLETRVGQLSRFADGIARLQDEGLFDLASQFASQGPESVGTLEALIADIDSGGSTAFTLDETIAKSESEISRWAAEMGLEFALATGPLLDQGRTFGEQWAEAVAAGISDTQLQFLLSAQVIDQSTPSGLPRGFDQGLQFRANGGPVIPGSSYIVGERGPELFSPSAAGVISPTSNTVSNHFTFAPVISSTAAAADLSDELVRKFSDEVKRFDAGARRPR